MQAFPISASGLGPRPEGDATTFSVESAVAEAVELCIFDGGEETRHWMRHMVESDRFEIRVEGVGPGTEYGYRVHGPWDPQEGHRCNPAKLLVDPYARRMSGEIRGHVALLGHATADPAQPSSLDSAPYTLRSVVVDTRFDWGEDPRPSVPLTDTVIYETHVKGISMLHPEVPPEIRGTYAGLAHPAVLEHLVGLGVTSVELLPIHQFVHDQQLLQSGRRNYWGYNSIGFFAPNHEYAATDDPVREWKEMVLALHRTGLEMICDVVYNHTAEGNHLGPTLCFRGLDNASWYRLDPADPSRYLNWTGTGNTVDLSSPVALRLVMDSLRYWVTEMGVDGFRFDLATVLGRTHERFDPLGAFLGAVAQDPVLRNVKLIAEPWDVGPGGYQLGQFPRGWSEWNDRYRDTVRDFWRGQEGVLGQLASRITGSSDLFEETGRRPSASVNLVTSHDGFTLTDLVSYDQRHNHANGEGNRDGHKDNRSWNTGIEGPIDDPAVNALRTRRKRSMLATLLLSQGVPMLLGGDELGRTQRGNNNPYNQDNEISWYSWDGVDTELLAFTKRMIDVRRRHPTFRRTGWLHEHARPEEDHVGWFTPAGKEMTVSDWQSPFARSVCLYLDGSMVHSSEGVVSDDDFLLLFNGYDESMEFVVPVDDPEGWELLVDTGGLLEGSESMGDTIPVPGYGLVVLHRPRDV